MKAYKFIGTLLTTTTLLGPLTVFSSCSSDNSKQIATEIVKKGYAEFEEIAKYPRPSGHTYEIRNYLINRIKALGYTPMTDVEEGTEDTQANSQAANIWFDVPATAGCENYKKVILQGHMDMVVDGLAGEAAWTTPIVPEYHEDNHSVTSKDHKTSLGADDGIGVGTLLAFIQNPNIKHGPLRVLITADEEIGMVGAKRLDASVLEPYDYLLNLDGELDYEGYYRSCQGAIQYDYGKTFTKADIPSDWKVFDLYVEGFKGGHSGNDINKNLANADVFINWLLSELDGQYFLENNVQIIEYNHKNKEGVDSVPSSTAIPRLGRVVFATSKSQTDIENAFNETVSWFKAKYTGETWTDVELDLKEVTESVPTKGLSTTDSKTIISLMSNCDPERVGFVYGYIPEPSTNRPILSCNISPLQIWSLNDTEMQFTLSTNGRAVAKNSMQFLEEIWTSTFYSHMTQTSGLANKYTIYPWEPNNNDIMQKLAHEGYQKLNIDPYIRDTNGCVEPAPFCAKKPTLQQTCLGTKFEGVHTINETCYLDNLVNSVCVMKYILENTK